MAADFFAVPTLTYRLLFVLVLLAHDRRRIVHIADVEREGCVYAARRAEASWHVFWGVLNRTMMEIE
jgi:hypothetical protein